jgi:hypothetical protein
MNLVAFSDDGEGNICLEMMQMVREKTLMIGVTLFAWRMDKSGRTEVTAVTLA